jgi:hypothetical protein
MFAVLPPAQMSEDAFLSDRPGQTLNRGSRLLLLTVSRLFIFLNN